MSLVRALSVSILFVAACSADPDEPAAVLVSPAPIPVDGGSDVVVQDAAPEAALPPKISITVSTLAPDVPGSPGGKLSATWAAWQDDRGDWQTTAPVAEGTYAFTVSGATWAIALACEDANAMSSVVAVHRRSSDAASLEIALDPECLVMPTAFYDVTGTLSNVPPTTSWLEIGDPLESRGGTLAVDGTTATYELDNVRGGTWDFAWGLRDESYGPLTRAAFERGTVLAASAVLDLDFASAFAPTPQVLAVHGLMTNEVVDVAMFYATNAGLVGLTVGPQDVPTTTPDVTTSYDGIPASEQSPGDRYRAALVAKADKASAIVRTIDVSFHGTIDVDVTLPPVIDEPTAIVTRTAARVDVTARVAPYNAAATYEILAAVPLDDQHRRAYRATLPASMVNEAVAVTPDLAALPGFRASWMLPLDADVDVTATGIEAPTPLGDGTQRRASSRRITAKLPASP